MNAMTASVIAATLTTPDDITRPAADAFVDAPEEETESDLKNQDTATAVAAASATSQSGAVDTVDYLANKLTPNDARVMVDLLKLAVAGRVSATAQSVLSSSLAAIGEIVGYHC